MNRIHITGILTGILFILSGCGSGDSPQGPQDGRITLQAGASGISGEMDTRAAEGFPNDGSIGVIAGYYNDGKAVDWTSYADIDNAHAVAATKTGNEYFFEFDQVRYWPFDGRSLSFMAYSPYATTNNVLLDDTNTSLNLVLGDGMPDVMYASSNTGASLGAYNKLSPSPVDLGTFKHALSKVVVRVEAAATISGDITLTDLSLSTNRRNGILSLPDGDEGLTVLDDQDYPYEFLFVQGNTPMPSSRILADSAYLFPGTEDYTMVTIGFLASGGQTFYRQYPVSYFSSANPIHLQRAKRTVLNILINGTPVDGSEDNLELEAIITDWNDGGHFGITIH